MSVGGIDTCAGGAPTSPAELSPQQAMAAAQVDLLDTMLDMAAQPNAQMLQSLQAGSPAGVGGSVDTYG